MIALVGIEALSSYEALMFENVTESDPRLHSIRIERV